VVFGRDLPTGEEHRLNRPHRVGRVVDVQGAGVGVRGTAVGHELAQAWQSLGPSFRKPAPASVQVDDKKNLVHLGGPLPELMRQDVARGWQVRRCQANLQGHRLGALH
jgi:hypothetical protein